MGDEGIDSKLCIIRNDLYWKDSSIVDRDVEMVQIDMRITNEVHRVADF